MWISKDLMSNLRKHFLQSMFSQRFFSQNIVTFYNTNDCLQTKPPTKVWIDPKEQYNEVTKAFLTEYFLDTLPVKTTIKAVTLTRPVSGWKAWTCFLTTLPCLASGLRRWPRSCLLSAILDCSALPKRPEGPWNNGIFFNILKICLEDGCRMSSFFVCWVP